MNKQEMSKLEAMRHSCEHVLTMAMLRLYPSIKAAMGPAIEDGFYFDFDPGKVKISEADFPAIEKEMAKIIKANMPIAKGEMSASEAHDFFNRNIYQGNQYKHEWIDAAQKRGEKVIVYWIGDMGKDIPESFVDICAGPHVSSTGKIGPFKLLSVAGAYWHGDEKNKMLTRIYGTCFPTQKELDQYLWQIAEAKKRDHRVLGQKLELFMFDDEVGQGLPLYLPNGAMVRHLLVDYALNTYFARGYLPVSTPHIGSETLWAHSGHLQFYADSMYGPLEVEGHQYRLKPMNCPFHVKMYNAKTRSYRDLPIRWTEMGTVYRYEKSGELHGLVRPRGFTQDDGHIICTGDQLAQEVRAALDLTIEIYRTLQMENLIFKLSVRDMQQKNKYFGADADWNKAEKTLKQVLIDAGHTDFETDIGGAVFYAPKIDIDGVDSLGRRWQLSTIQIDFNLPSRFAMKYTDQDGKEQVPFMIHRALLGSLERFLGVYIEHTGGAFPVWLSPVQAAIIPIAERHQAYAETVCSQLTAQKIRVKLDNRAISMQKKLKEAEEQKIPFMLVVGDQEITGNSVAVRQRGKKDLGKQTIDQFLAHINSLVAKKSPI